MGVIDVSKLEVFRNRKAVRDVVADIDYVTKLSDSERQWLETFINATAAIDENALAALVPPTKFRRVYKQLTDASNARRRDMFINHTRIPNIVEADIEDEDSKFTFEAASKIRSDVFEYYKCSRCLLKAGECQCPSRQRNQPYGREDYTPIETSEDNIVDQVDIKKRMQAYDLLPFGTNPTGLQPGHAVQICLPFHLFKNAYGTIIEQRQDDKKYLVEIKSRRGLKDRDGTIPERITMYVAGTGLKRYPPTIVKSPKV